MFTDFESFSLQQAKPPLLRVTAAKVQTTFLWKGLILSLRVIILVGTNINTPILRITPTFPPKELCLFLGGSLVCPSPPNFTLGDGEGWKGGGGGVFALCTWAIRYPACIYWAPEEKLRSNIPVSPCGL